ncbi:hypothetical protein EUTSA_v10005278mg [Eutrema salsugineum]|uniref:At2g29880-like C-terminal domain-containing protein n=1 Tax=Eutrema salsugineum TaxID=72664 RepID=V4MNJ8_EUTSA|nr:hypothetical protein EUTSA_v10005278mg [Eutrema salsugineum]
METGEASQPKKKGGYFPWTSQESQLLKRLLVDGIKQGWRDSNGSISKSTIETRILPVLNKKLGCKLLRCSSGFGWDPILKQFTASDEVWEEYFKGHPNHEYMRSNTFEDFEDLQIIFESAIAKGNNVFGLGGDSNAATFEVENDVQEREDVHMENVCEANETSYETPKEKLPSRKRVKTHGNPSESINHDDRSEKVITEMIGVSTNLINLIQQREERHQREEDVRETEKNKNNVWDAIKEIPNLEEYIRYDAVTKIHKLKMKDVFVYMSIEERLGWILRNT